MKLKVTYKQGDKYPIVTNLDTGEPVECVTKIELYFEAGGPRYAKVEMILSEVDLEIAEEKPSEEYIKQFLKSFPEDAEKKNAVLKEFADAHEMPIPFVSEVGEDE